ncbi:hypothetical protein KY289_026738 [Solanum tuberosum]|nr:hypothetical protein KY289_026738 [Solanum tuberosum]
MVRSNGKIKYSSSIQTNNRKSRRDYRPIMSRQLEIRKSNGKFRRGNKQKTKSKHFPKQHGDLYHHNIRQPRTTCNRHLPQQEQPNKGIAGDNTNKGKSDHEVQTIEGSRDDESNHTTTNVLKDHVTDNCYNKTSGIDLSLPLPHSPNGGIDGGCQEKTTNLQEGATKGGNLTHVLFEGAHNDLNSDLRASSTTTQNYAKTVHQVQEIQKVALAQDTGQGGHNQVDNTVDQVRAPKEYKQQKGQGAGTETNIQTQKKKGTVGIEGT